MFIFSFSQTFPSTNNWCTLTAVLAKTTGACDRTYTIQEGDICDSISASHNVSTWVDSTSFTDPTYPSTFRYQLAAINSGIIDSTCSNLVVGNSICLGYDGEDCSTTYVVAGGDNCDLITSKFGINGTILSLNNPQINKACDNIYVGEVSENFLNVEYLGTLPSPSESLCLSCSMMMQQNTVRF